MSCRVDVTQYRIALFPLTALAVVGLACASGELGPRSVRDPAHPSGPEGPTTTFTVGTPVANDDANSATAQDAGTVYACPMHPEVVQHAPGKCPKCGMELRRTAQAP